MRTLEVIYRQSECLRKDEDLVENRLISPWILANANDAPTTVHLSLRELPRLAFSFTELDG